MGIAFESSYLQSVVFDGSTATIEGTGFVAGGFAGLRIVMQDVGNTGVGKDTVAIQLSTGLTVSGTITERDIENSSTIHPDLTFRRSGRNRYRFHPTNNMT